MDPVLLMFHLLYSNTSQELCGGYSLYDYSFPWYQNHLWQDGIVLRSPYLPDRIAKYQGIQHYRPVDFFGGEEALEQRQELDRQKRQLCEQNDVRLIEWPYSLEPTDSNVREIFQKERETEKKKGE